MTRRVGWLVMCLAILVVCLPAPPASADADPASDFLLITPVFVPFNKPSQPQIDRLKTTVAAAKQRGYEIRVAVVSGRQDLGAVPNQPGRQAVHLRPVPGIGAGWEVPRATAGGDAAGLRLQHQGKTDKAGAQPLVALAPPASSAPDDLTAAATAAVRRLAQAAGVQVPVIPLKAATTPGTTAGGAISVTRWLLYAGLGVMILGVVVLVLLF